MRKGLSLPPYLHGGGQESNFRSGTEGLPLIAGFGAACKAAFPSLRQDILREQKLKELCIEQLSRIPQVQMIGAADAPHIINLSVPGVRSQGLINCLQDMDVYVSAGSACSKGYRSHVLEAMKVAPELIDGSVRVSLSRFTTEEEIQQLVKALKHAIDTLK